jgi:hypothetical protein
MEALMDAVRCPECGDVRWSFFGFGSRSDPLACELCGTIMVPERRRPKGVAVKPLPPERRHTMVAARGPDHGPYPPPAA